MNSPGEPISPSPSTPSSATPPNEEVGFQGTQGGSDSKGFMSSLTSSLSHFAGGGSSKRRLPAGGSFGQSSSNRDLKSRRRENTGSRMGTADWEGKQSSGAGAKRERDDLLDPHLVDYLRKEIGDPFQESKP
ncbi:hypothetical protein BKA70DRAFT_1304385 [Coprinopsis sp. MPI-PUGE-AT-0042]|nr:hypothetical protein BKA70DRAFT_1304385 [Coprinopsis sp. MPI-PUGE-AT-0042]